MISRRLGTLAASAVMLGACTPMVTHRTVASVAVDGGRLYVGGNLITYEGNAVTGSWPYLRTCTIQGDALVDCVDLDAGLVEVEDVAPRRSGAPPSAGPWRDR